ncbi:MAG: M48 family metalloprotease [Chitinispirillia bacterium]|nr:M48 family metalloprotease [Chitinispirillia bacterium]MCL2241816.1 M48 family metalloprotease [Chitinispirillia bacterium]
MVLIFIAVILGVFIFLNLKRPKPTDTVEDIKVSYVGTETQLQRNKWSTAALLATYPLLMAAMAFILASIFSGDSGAGATLFWLFLAILVIWTGISYFTYTKTIRRHTMSRPIERSENRRIYDLLENLCISCGMDMPQLCVIEDDYLNAFASGIKKEDYTVSLTRGLINNLTDEELEGVIAHELMHIRNGDAKLNTLSMVLNGVFSTISGTAQRCTTGLFKKLKTVRVNQLRDPGAALAIHCGMFFAAIFAFCLSLYTAVVTNCAAIMHFAISRKREFMADAGAAQMTGNTMALANALRKISGNDYIASVKNAEVASMFISNPCVNISAAEAPGVMTLRAKLNAKVRRFFFVDELAMTHPDIRVRIKILEQI